jgi:hypothetical protein
MFWTLGHALGSSLELPGKYIKKYMKNVVNGMLRYIVPSKFITLDLDSSVSASRMFINDKLKLYEEIDFLRKTTLISKEKLLHKASELEQWGKMSEIEQSREMYNFIQENSKTTSVGYANNATQDFYSNKLLDANNIFSIYSTVNEQIPGRRLVFSSEYFNDPIQRESWLRSNIFGSLSKIMFKLDIDIQGATNSIGTGHVINLVVPSGLDKKILPSSSTPILDQYHGGKYFVSGVQHNITLSSYVKKLELTRGSIPIDLNKNNLTQQDLSELKYL